MANIYISKEEFEAALPVAMTKNNDVYETLTMAIRRATEEVATEILGNVGVEAVETGEDGNLVCSAKALISFRAFLRNFRSLDLVLTATGFGVVSTQDTAPASKMRTDALKSQLDVEEKRMECALFGQLFKLEGWGAQSLRQSLVPTLFWQFDFLAKYAGVDSPTINDWRKAQPLIMEADGIIRRHIGNAYMEQLLTETATDAVSSENAKIILLIQQLIGLHVSGDKSAEKVMYRRLMNTLDDNIDDYPAYADSDEYKYNHFVDHENTKESTMFLFNG